MAEDLILGVDFDLSKVEAAIDKMQRQFNSTAKEMDRLPKIIENLDVRIEELNQKEDAGVKLTQQEVSLRSSLINQSAIYADRLQEMYERAEKLGAELDAARLDPESFAKAHGYIQEADEEAKKLPPDFQKIKSAAKDAGKEVDKIPQNLKKTEKAAKEAGDKTKKHLSGSFSSAKGALEKFVSAGKKIALMSFGVLTVTSLLKKMVTSLKDVVKSNNTVSTSLGRIKSNLAVAFQPIIDKIIPWLIQLLSWLEKVTAAFASFTNKLMGANIGTSIQRAKSTYDTLFNSKGGGGKTAQIDNQIKALKREISDLEKANKALKREYQEQKKELDKQKQAINDQINDIDNYIKSLKKQEAAEKSLAQAKRAALDAEIDTYEKQKKVRQNELADQRKAVSEREAAINREIKALQKRKNALEKAKKEDQKSLAGFDTMQVLSGSSAEEDDPETKAIEARIDALEEEKEALQEVAAAIPEDSDDPLVQQIESQIEALTAQKEAIEDVDYSSMIEQQEAAKDSLKEQIELIDTQADKLREDYEMKLLVNEDAKTQLQDQIDKLEEAKEATEDANDTPYNPDTKGIGEAAEGFDDLNRKIHLIIEAVVGVMSVIAIVVGAFTGNIPLIIAGVVGLIGVIWDVIETWGGDIKKWWLEKAWPWLKSLPGKIWGHIKQAFSDFYHDFLEPLIVEPIQEAWEWLKDLWHNHISKIFTKEWWTDKFDAIKQGGKAALNGLLGIVESAVNWIVDKLNLLQFDVPDWVPGIGGATFGFDIPHVSIPALARGAVLPGGKPWLAIVNDQPAGQTNVEAPLDTIKQALAEVMANQGEQTINISFNGSLGQLARVLEPEIEVARKRASAFV